MCEICGTSQPENAANALEPISDLADQKTQLQRQVANRRVNLPVSEVNEVLKDVLDNIGEEESERFARQCLPGLIRMAVDNDLLSAMCWSRQVISFLPRL